MKRKKDVGWLIPTAVFLGGIGGGIVFPILPVLGIEFGLSAFFIGLIISANKFTRVFINQLVGITIDTFGGKKPLVLGLIIESIGSILYVVSLYFPPHGILLFLGRIVWGIGSAFLFISANTIALNLSETATRGKSTAKVRIALSLGVPAGLVIGGILSSLISNCIAFLSSAIASILGALLVIFFFKEKVKPAGKNAINLKESFKFMFSNRDIAVISMGNFLTFFSLQGVVMATLVLFIKERNITLIYPDPRFTSGLAMAFMMASSGIFGIAAGRIVDRLKYRSTIGFPATLVVFLGFLLLAFSKNSFQVIVSLIMLGIAIGSNNISLLSILGDITPLQNRGKAVSVYQLLGDIGGTLGPIFGIQIGIIYKFSTTYIITGFVILLNLFIFFYLLKLEKQTKR